MRFKKRTANDNNNSVQEQDYLSDLSKKSNSELLDELEVKMSTMTEETFNSKLVEKYLKLLQERAPVMEDYDSASEFSRLKENHSVLFEDDNSINNSIQVASHHRKVLHIAEVTIAAVLCLTISVKAFGFNPINMFLNWKEEVLQMQSEPSGIMDLPEDCDSEYKSLKEALASNGVSTSCCPTWIPKDFALEEVNVRETSNAFKYIGYYTSTRGDLIIRIIYYKIDKWTYIAEKEAGGRMYQSAGNEFYILSNEDSSKAGWAYEKASYSISGQITENEIEKMIDSIQEE